MFMSEVVSKKTIFCEKSTFTLLYLDGKIEYGTSNSGYGEIMFKKRKILKWIWDGMGVLIISRRWYVKNA